MTFSIFIINRLQKRVTAAATKKTFAYPIRSAKIAPNTTPQFIPAYKPALSKEKPFDFSS